MDRMEKITRLQELRKEIRDKETQVQKAEQELKALQDEYQKENTSELPILLFMVDQTIPMPDDADDWRFLYIYYFPDMEEMRCIEKSKRDEFLPNTVDFREQFEDLGMPKRSWPENAYYSHYSIIMQAVSILKSQTDALFESNDISSWADLGRLLTEGTSEKGQPKLFYKSDKN